MLADLHIHSRYSDGSYTLEEAFALAKKKHLTHLSFVDHDTTEGCIPAQAMGKRIGIQAISGVEISAYDFEKNRKIHLLGYNFSLPAPHIEELCTPIREARHENTLRQLKIIQDLGYPVSLSEVQARAYPSQILYKQHIMLVLMDKGITDGIYSSLYKELFKNGGPASGDILYAEVFDALSAILKDGGKAVLAHPGQQDSFDLVPALAKRGLWGIELHHEDHSKADRKRILDLAKTYGLKLTGGSDDHGSFGSLHPIGDYFSRDLPLNTPEQHPYLAPVLDWVQEAGDYLRKAVTQVHQVEKKGGVHWDLVTEHDLFIHHFFQEKIQALNGDHVLLSEEEDHVPLGEYLWILDPIDGTTNFTALGRDFTISLALARKGRVELGVIYDVIGDQVYWAVKGQGAFCQDQRISTDSLARVSELLAEVSHGSLSKLASQHGMDIMEGIGEFRGHRAYGCASLGICKVATGDLGLYTSCKLNLWDYAAAALILEEAGGAVYLEDDLLDHQDIRKTIHFIGAASQEVLERYRDRIRLEPSLS